MPVNSVSEFRNLYNDLATNTKTGPGNAPISDKEFYNNLLGAYRHWQPDAVEKFVLLMTTDIPPSLLHALSSGDYEKYASRPKLHSFTLTDSQKEKLDDKIDVLCSQVLGKKKVRLDADDFRKEKAFDHDMMARLQAAAYSGAGISKPELKKIIEREVGDAGPTGGKRWEGREKLTLMMAIRDLPFASKEALEAAVACTQVNAGGKPDQIREFVGDR